MKQQAAKNQIVAYVDLGVYFKLVEVSSKRGFKTLSIAINECLKEFFSGIDEQMIAVNRLNEVIQTQENKIRNLEYELRSKNQVPQEIKGGVALEKSGI